MSMAALSSEAAQGLFESGYVIPATATVAASSNAANSEHIYAELGKLWAQTRRGLDALPPAQSHVPGEGRTIDEDLEDCVLAANTVIWASAPHDRHHAAVQPPLLDPGEDGYGCEGARGAARG